MFKKFRERVSEEFQQAKTSIQSQATQYIDTLVNSSSSADEETVKTSSSGKTTAVSSKVSHDLLQLNDAVDDASAQEIPTPSDSKFGQFSLVDLDDEEASGEGNKSSDTIVASGSGASAATGGNQSSDGDSFLSMTPTTSPSHPFVPQSDVESEYESEVHSPRTINVDSVSKDQLIDLCVRLQNRGKKYKSYYGELKTAYKSLIDERDKMRKVLVEHQDKTLKRINELKEQCNLEVQAKRHLEENLRVFIEEKDEKIKVLEAKIGLLNAEADSDGHDVTENSFGNNDLVSKLQDKVKHLEGLLQRCKESLKANKEKLVQTNLENEEFSKYREQCQDLKQQLDDLTKKRQEDEEAFAKAKASLHGEIEKRNQTIRETRVEVELKLSKIGKLEVELKQKTDMFDELQQRIVRAEAAVDDEKKSLAEELSRGKSAAIHLIKEESEKKISQLNQELEHLKLDNSDLKSKVDESERQQIGEIKNQIEQTKTQNEQLKAEMNQLQATLDKTMGDLKSVQEQREEEKLKLEQLLANAESKSKTLMEEIERLNDRCSNLEPKQELLEKAEMRIEEAMNEMEMLRKQLLEKDSAIEMLKIEKLKNPVINEVVAEEGNRPEKDDQDDGVDLEMDRLKQDNETLTIQIEEMKRKTEDIRVKLDEEMKSKDELKCEKEQFKSRLDEAVKKYEDLQVNKESVDKAHEEARVSLANALNELENRDKRLGSVNQELDELKAKLESVYQTTKDVESKNESLVREKNELTGRIQAAESDKKQTDVDKSKYLQIIDELRQELTMAAKGKMELQGQIDGCQKEIDDLDKLKKESEETKKKLAQVETRVGDLKKVNKELRKKIEVLEKKEKEFEKKEKESEKKEKEFEELKKQHEELETELKKLEDHSQKLEEVCQQHYAQVEELSNKLSECEFENDDLRTRMQHCQEIENQLKKQGHEKDEKIGKLKKKLGEEVKRISDLTTIQEQVKRTAEDKEREIGKLKETIEQLRRQSLAGDDLAQENRLLNDKIEQLEKQISDLTRLKGELEEALKSQSLNHAAEMDQMKSKISEEQKSHEAIVDRLYKTIEERDSQLDEKMLAAESNHNTTAQELIDERGKNKKLNEHLEEERAKREELAKHNEELKTKLSQLEKTKTATGDIKLMEQRVKQLEEELMEKQAELESRIEKFNEKEEGLICQHQKQITTMEQELSEKNSAIEEVHDYYQQRLQEKEEQLKTLHDEFGSSTVNEHAYQVKAMQKSLLQYQEENVRLRELLDIRNRADSNNSCGLISGVHLPEPTEYEYLRNIIFEFMMGREPVTLSKVIAAVMRFSNDQTEQIVHRQEAAANSMAIRTPFRQ